MRREAYNIRMTKFCEGCPLRRNAGDELVGVVYNRGITYRKLGAVRRFAALGALFDSARRISAVLHLPANVGSSDTVMHRLLDSVDRCTEPLTTEKGWIRKRRVITGCPALGDIALNTRTQMGMEVARQIRPHLSNLALGADVPMENVQDTPGLRLVPPLPE